ncbi:hypothetical protein Plhal703r1_c78g0173341 [Plasmopara halstedii]
MSAITGFFGASTIFSRLAAGPLLDRYGPQVVQKQCYGCALPIFCAAFVQSLLHYLHFVFLLELRMQLQEDWTLRYWMAITIAFPAFLMLIMSGVIHFAVDSCRVESFKIFYGRNVVQNRK